MNSKKLLYPILFMAFFVGGVAMAFSSEPTLAVSKTTFAGSVPAGQSVSVQVEATLASITDFPDQLNILMIGVDQVGSNQTQLRSLWLVIVSPQGGPLTFMPIYPQPTEIGAAAYTSPHDAIIVDARFPESATIIRLLADQNTWWDEVILFDETGMLSILELIGGISAYSTELNGIIAGQGAPSTWQDPQSALAFQSALLHQVCNNSSAFTSAFTSERFALPNPEHVKISNNRIDLLVELYYLNSSMVRFGCQFPAFD